MFSINILSCALLDLTALEAKSNVSESTYFVSHKKSCKVTIYEKYLAALLKFREVTDLAIATLRLS